MYKLPNYQTTFIPQTYSTNEVILHNKKDSEIWVARTVDFVHLCCEGGEFSPRLPDWPLLWPN